MKTITILIALIFFTGFNAVKMPETNFSTNVEQKQENNPVLLQGSLLSSPQRSSQNPIEVSLASGSLSVHFNANLGNVTIEITNVFGVTVYSTFINSAVQNTVIIPTGGFASGNYTITFINNNGVASGSFNI